MSDDEAGREIPFSTVVPTVYGPMIVNRHDINQTSALFKTGKAVDHNDIQMLADILRRCEDNRIVLDIGANFGTYSLGLAPAVGPLGRIHAFEPQRHIFNMLAGSVALNSLTNVHCHHMAVGDHEGMVELPQFDYGKTLNFGSIEFGPEQIEPLNQPRGTDPERIEYVPLTTIDRFGFQRVDLMKIDVEGMEMRVLAGAEQTIGRCQPMLFIEFIKSDRAELRARIGTWDYDVYAVRGNFLCMPRRLRSRIKIEGVVAE